MNWTGLVTAIVLCTTTDAGSFGNPGLARVGSAGGPPTHGDNAPNPVARAIRAAEQHLGGMAVGTGWERKDGGRVFYVEVLRYGLKHKVLVDLRSGLVVGDDAWSRI